MSTQVTSRNCRAAVGPLVRRMGIPCDALLTRDDVAAVKPDPVHLRSALRRLEVPAGGTLVVGDHPFDVRAARRLGMHRRSLQRKLQKLPPKR